MPVNEKQLSVIRGRRTLLSPVGSWGGHGVDGWQPVIDEPYTGAWQNDDEWIAADFLCSPIVYACVTLISNDIGKLRMRLVKTVDGIKSEVETNSPYWPVLRKPNRYQNQIQFKEWWIMSKLRFGNAYALKQRDERGIVTALYILNPCLVQPLVSDDGSIFYQLNQDNLSNLPGDGVVVPADDIIHDRMNCLYHPLVGIPPIYAAAIVAGIGLRIQRNVAHFFGNKSTPSGVLVAPGVISEPTAKLLKETWSSGYAGSNSGKVAVLAEGMKFEPMSQTASDAQLIEILKWSDERICSVFHVPAYKVGVGTPPAYNNIEALNQEYYQQALQTLIEEFELCMTEGLSTPVPMSVDVDLEGLLRMDAKTQMEVLSSGIQAKVFTINDARKKVNMLGLTGGETVYMQQQDFPLEEIRKNKLPEEPAVVEPVVEESVVEEEEPTPEAEEEMRALMEYIQKGLTDA